MIDVDLETTYREYIECLNKQDWNNLSQFVHDDVHHNGRPLGINGYRTMLESDYEQIPDLRFTIEMLVADTQRIASRLRFDVTPKADFLDLPVNGRKVTFCENVFYEYQHGKIREVWSVIDKAAIELQLR
ncbi:putative ester cyclase [Ochrobactrum daejeonense]|uniref:Putative ester cyclase n=1 Tax=Brucella daejeonensis TaxID=659015 RepID=A0A7W9AUV9_9HYPH|nr:ester cyclase [Brucella daejeonensis]MBB5701043.1 putative ester cyclase [Brucella daejeonensis]NKB79678.1 SnoaL-like domain-containing protein [Brucella daejeonensis]